MGSANSRIRPGILGLVPLSRQRTDDRLNGSGSYRDSRLCCTANEKRPRLWSLIVGLELKSRVTKGRHVTGFQLTQEPLNVPEPSIIALMCIGLAGIGFRRYKTA